MRADRLALLSNADCRRASAVVADGLKFGLAGVEGTCLSSLIAFQSSVGFSVISWLFSHMLGYLA